eukprot:c10697_g1_i2 orf=174-512(+)
MKKAFCDEAFISTAFHAPQIPFASTIQAAHPCFRLQHHTDLSQRCVMFCNGCKREWICFKKKKKKNKRVDLCTAFRSRSQIVLMWLPKPIAKARWDVRRIALEARTREMKRK